MEVSRRIDTSQRHHKKSRSSRCDLIFPVGRVNRYYMQGKYGRKVGIGAAIYTAAVLEYLTTEVLTLAGQVAEDEQMKKITPKHIQVAIRGDEEINRLLVTCTMSITGDIRSNIKFLLMGSSLAAEPADK